MLLVLPEGNICVKYKWYSIMIDESWEIRPNPRCSYAVDINLTAN